MTSWRRWRKCLSPARIRADVVEQVGEDRHHAPLLEPLGQVVEDQPQVRLLARGRDVQQVEQLLQVRRLARPASGSGGPRRRRSTRPTESCCWRIMYASDAATNWAYCSLVTFSPEA